MTMDAPKAAIIYLTYNTSESYADITRCFRTLSNLDYPRDRVEIVCVENPSPHGASWPFIEKEWLPLAGTSFPKLTIRRNERDLGYSGANDVGIAIAKEHGCEYAFLLNQDSDVDPSFLRRAVERAEADPDVMFVQSLILLGQDRMRVNSVGNRYHFLGFGYAGGHGWSIDEANRWIERERKTNPDLVVPYVSGAAILVRLSMTEKIGLFDAPFYMYHEDVDATFNARIHGWKSVLEPSSVVYHYYAFSKSIKKFYWMERNRYIVNLTYYKLPTLILLAPAFLAVEIASGLFALKGGWWKEKRRSWSFLLKPSSWTWIGARRKKAMQERLIGDRELLKWCESRILFQGDAPGGNDDMSLKRDVGGSIVQRIANPLLTAIWRVAYFLIRW